ncbi:hypothetical protein GCM10010112_21900 [Actinoplanes lobatus]|nr:hypothetical protein GCM10010112_21900 [Actinoplanes lobatus]GIE40476.1 hypothetical protein Alo02nite_33740 [Actinoplanes lobatus]
MTLDASGGSAPPSPDAGAATPLVADLLAALLGASSTLVGGLHEIGGLVTDARQVYAREDRNAGQSINGTL